MGEQHRKSWSENAGFFFCPECQETWWESPLPASKPWKVEFSDFKSSCRHSLYHLCLQRSNTTMRHLIWHFHLRGLSEDGRNHLLAHLNDLSCNHTAANIWSSQPCFGAPHLDQELATHWQDMGKLIPPSALS